MMLASAFCTVVTAIPFFALLEMASLPAIIIVRMTIVLFGVWFTAPFHSWAQKWAPLPHRYSIISFGYALGSQLIGGPTAVISLWIYQQTNWAWAASCYWLVLAFAAGVALAFALANNVKRRGMEMDQNGKEWA